MRMQRFGTYNAVLPPEGPCGFPSILDFGSEAEHEIDMNEAIANGTVAYVSGVYIDNRSNPNELDIVVGGSGQTMGFPAGKCGYMPLMLTDSATCVFRSEINGGTKVQVIMVNFPVWPCIF